MTADIVDGNMVSIAGLLWSVIRQCNIRKFPGGAGSAGNDLLVWVRKKIPECNVNDFDVSWMDGRAVCHLSEALKPGCFSEPLNNLVGREWQRNAEQGMDVAETELGIPKILAPEDMVA